MVYLVLGYGKFGQIAVNRLTAAFPAASIIVVERDPERIDVPLAPQVTTVQGDATEVLVREEVITPEAIIIPMVPFHLAASFVKARMPRCNDILLPENLGTLVPHPLPVSSSTLCCSKADFVCPDDCPEDDLCTVTGLPRTPLYRTLEALHIPGFTVFVLRSRQILPGVGGYTFQELESLRQSIVAGRYVVATSCKCHAIVSGLEAH
jgi:hypothetical protein